MIGTVGPLRSLVRPLMAFRLGWDLHSNQPEGPTHGLREEEAVGVDVKRRTAFRANQTLMMWTNC